MQIMAWRLNNPSHNLAMVGSSSSPAPPPIPLYHSAAAETGDMKLVHNHMPPIPDQFNATMAFASQSRKRKVPHKQSITQENLDCNIDDDDELPDEDDTNDLDLDMDDIKISRRGNMHNLVKKRRLTSEQVKFLEASFNMDLKLEPERKALIAKQLGLRPRQVAIWFQNRRARWKNKQLEHEYEALKLKYEALVKDNDLKRDGSMMEEENKKLHLEVARLTALLLRHTDETRHGGIKSAHTKVNGISSGTETTKMSPDLTDSDSESGSMKEQLSAKSELASPTKSSIDEQSEMQGSSSQKQYNVCGFNDHQHPILLAQDETIMFENNHRTFMFHQFVHGFNGTTEELFSHWEDQAHAFTIWGG